MSLAYLLDNATQLVLVGDSGKVGTINVNSSHYLPLGLSTAKWWYWDGDRLRCLDWGRDNRGLQGVDWKEVGFRNLDWVGWSLTLVMANFQKVCARMCSVSTLSSSMRGLKSLRPPTWLENTPILTSGTDSTTILLRFLSRLSTTYSTPM